MSRIHADDRLCPPPNKHARRFSLGALTETLALSARAHASELERCSGELEPEELLGISVQTTRTSPSLFSQDSARCSSSLVPGHRTATPITTAHTARFIAKRDLRRIFALNERAMLILIRAQARRRLVTGTACRHSIASATLTPRERWSRFHVYAPPMRVSTLSTRQRGSRRVLADDPANPAKLAVKRDFPPS